MSTRVSVQPALLQWAADRAGLDQQSLLRRFPRYDQWRTGIGQPTLKQLQDFAQATHTPIGYMFLERPPKLDVPIPDFRTMDGGRPSEPSPDLLDTVYICQQRQEWYRDYARSTGEAPPLFIGSVTTASDVPATAAAMRQSLSFDLQERRQCRTWEEGLRQFIEQADSLGVLVMVSGVVGSNNTRKLDPSEFRGFALSDRLAPLVFINGADTKSAQMFTLAHELAHLWLGQSALSDSTPATAAPHEVERWCNRVAAELLVPLAEFRQQYRRAAAVADEMARLARIFKVSTLVILRRMHDAGGLSRERFRAVYQAEAARLREIVKGTGGDYYLTTAARVSRRFARAVVISSLEGRSSLTEAFRLLGCRKMSTFRELGQSVGVDA